MEETLPEDNDNERRCQAVSPANEVCGFPATVRCTTCGGWFCDAHAEDEQWHRCVLLPGFN